MAHSPIQDAFEAVRLVLRFFCAVMDALLEYLHAEILQQRGEYIIGGDVAAKYIV